MSADRKIELRGVCVHNLKHIDLDIPHGQLVVLCGVSGSGKSSLAFDTLYAEGQRRYIETFSAYTRQFLEQLEKPAAERIDHIPPAIAVARRAVSRSNRSTVGTTTEIVEHLQLLFARIGTVVCQQCGTVVRRQTPESAASLLETLPANTRFQVAFPVGFHSKGELSTLAEGLREEGFIRAILGERTVELGTAIENLSAFGSVVDGGELYVVVDRLVAGQVSAERLTDSLETAFHRGEGAAAVFVEADHLATQPGAAPQAAHNGPMAAAGTPYSLDGAAWRRYRFSNRLRCEICGREYPQPHPNLFSFNSPLGACPRCEGFGNVVAWDLELVVPDPRVSIRDGAIAPWNTPAYRHELEELLALAADYGIPVDVPFQKLSAEHLRLIRDGVPERRFGGLRGFFEWLERRKYKMHIRVFLNRWRSYRVCPACQGARLRAESLATRIGGKNIAEVCALKIVDALAFFRQLSLTPHEAQVGRLMLEQIANRLRYLVEVGLGYLTLDRPLRTLSGGEGQRVALTSALGSSLVNALYVLDEPSIGLHPRDSGRLIDSVRRLRERRNTVVVVEHEEAFIRAADQVIEIGPGAGQRGGQIVFQGTPAEMAQSSQSLTGDYLAGRRAIRAPLKRRQPNQGWIRLAGARGNNLKNLTVEFPLGVLCVVTGVSGAGKSTLVQDTLYPALCRRMRKDAEKPLEYDDVFGDGQINDCMMVDQSPIGRSPRSNPVTYIKAFDEIRAIFAETVDARTRNYTMGHFSFNSAEGRCELCQGEGYLRIDMQFLADVYMRCTECGGTRYRREILDVRYRDRNIAEVLEMTVREAFGFFRGHPKAQSRLKQLMAVGLDYLRLGQPANTLSGGEAQRLKLAAYLSSARRGRTLFILDEPTTGLHFSDVVQLIDCFDALLAVGHSLLVIEHNLQIIKSADYVIDLGPDAAEAGGQIVATGTPEMVSRAAGSITGKFLAEALADDAEA
jgi:excinuclease ABC subunit A